MNIIEVEKSKIGTLALVGFYKALARRVRSTRGAAERRADDAMGRIEAELRRRARAAQEEVAARGWT